MSSVALPWDVFDDITDILFDENLALCACSLVCRRALSSSRRHLFRVVKLHWKNVHSFHELITSPHSTILPYVHKLVMKGVGSDSRQTAELCQIIDLLGANSPIETLVIRKVVWESVAPAVQSSIRSHLVGVLNLEIQDMDFRAFTSMMELVASFPLLEHLLLDCEFGAESPSIPLEFPVCPNLEYIDLINYDQRSLSKTLAWLLSHDKVPGIRRLSILGPSSTAPPAKIFHIGGHHLQYLCLRVPMYDFRSDGYRAGTEAYCKDIDLSTNTNLSTIRLEVNPIYSDDQRFDVVPGILSKIDSACLEQVELRIDFISSIDLGRDLDVVHSTEGQPHASEPATPENQTQGARNVSTWARIDEVLTGPQFPHLRSVDVWVNAPHAPIWVRRQLPDCDARRLLYIHE